YAKEHGGEEAPTARVLDALITEKLLEKEVTAQGIAARDDEIERYIAAIRERNGMDAGRFEAALAGQGMTAQAYRAKVKGEMETALDQAVFTLKPGQVSDPIRARGGFHLLRIDERIANAYRPLEEVSDEIRESLYNEALEERFQNWMSRDLRERHHVEVFN